jgi:hypothetical protein
MIVNHNLTEYMGPETRFEAIHDYAEAVDAAIVAGTLEGPFTSRCPECDFDFADADSADLDEDHLIVALTSDTFAVVVACEGYFVIDPNLVGIESRNWQGPDTNDKGYPRCPGSTVEDPHWLCFMERRDLNECPECDHPIPEALKLNNDMTGPRT